MNLTKKHFFIIAFLLTEHFFFFAWNYLPPEVVEPRADNMLLLAVKVFFLSATLAIFFAGILVLIIKRDFVIRQWKTLNTYKHFLRLLVKRDFVTRYRRSFLGVLWSLLNPLLTMLVLTMVFSFIFRMEIPYFPVYLLSGQIIFGFFSESTTLAMGSIIGSANVIKKVYVPKYVFPVARIMSSLVNLLFSFLAFLLVFLVTKAPFHWTVLLIPVPVLYTFVFSLGVGMLLSSLAVFFRDLTYLYGVLVALLTYLTPIFYPVSILPKEVERFIGLNPIYHYVDYFRNLTLNGVVPGLWPNVVCIGFALSAFCCGLYVTMSQQDKYILYL